MITPDTFRAFLFNLMHGAPFWAALKLRGSTSYLTKTFALPCAFLFLWSRERI